MKQLTKQLETLKRGGGGGGADDLDRALAEEMSAQLERAGQEAREAKREAEALKAERQRLEGRLEVVEAASGRMVEMKVRHVGQACRNPEVLESRIPVRCCICRLFWFFFIYLQTKLLAILASI